MSSLNGGKSPSGEFRQITKLDLVANKRKLQMSNNNVTVIDPGGLCPNSINLLKQDNRGFVAAAH